MRASAIVTKLALVLPGLALLLSGRPAAQTNGSPERFTAVAVNMGTPGRAFTDRVEIVVEKWSPGAERDRLLNTLFEKGPEKLLDTLQDLPRVGYFRTPNSIGYDLHFARKHPGEDGGEQIILMTDRRIGFWEARDQPRTMDYPFTLMDIRVNTKGEGEGKLSVATKISYNKKKNTVEIENYASEPVRLQNVRPQK